MAQVSACSTAHTHGAMSLCTGITCYGALSALIVCSAVAPSCTCQDDDRGAEPAAEPCGDRPMDLAGVGRCLQSFLRQNVDDPELSRFVADHMPLKRSGANAEDWVWSLGHWSVDQTGTTVTASLARYESPFHTYILTVRLEMDRGSYVVREWRTIHKSYD